jgi:DNA-binding transcriptional LysR family regulator
MELRHLRYFVAVAEEENMGRAAARLRVAQSALSRQLQDLEREVGASLFERLSRGVRLTEAGRAFEAPARRAIAAADEAARAARDVAAGALGTLRIAPPDFGARAELAADAIARFRAARPRVAVELVAVPWPEHVAQLLADRIDVGFAVASAPTDYPPAIRAERVDDEPLAWALLARQHALASRAELTLAELAHVPMVLSERVAIPGMHDRIMGAVRAAGIEPHVVSSPPAFASVAQLVSVGAGWCAVVASVAAQPPAGTVAVPVPELGRGAALELHVLRRRADGDDTLPAVFTRCVHAALAAAR